MGSIRPNCWNYNWIIILKKNKGIAVNLVIPFFYFVPKIIKVHMPIKHRTYNKKLIFSSCV